MEQCLGAVFIVRWTAWLENIGFWRVHCATTVACGGGREAKPEMKHSKECNVCNERTENVGNLVAGLRLE